MYHRTLGRPSLQRFLGSAQKFWDQFDEYDSRGLHCVKQTSEKTKVHRWIKYKSKLLHQRSPYAVKFEARSQAETEARGDAWRLANHIYKLKEKDKATFFSPTDEWILPAASTIKPGEREFLVDCGASMHMVSRKDFNKAELKTVRTSKSPTTVVTANGEVPTKEEATVYVSGLDLFVTVMLLEDTPAVFSLWKLCEDHGYTYHWTSGQKPRRTT